MLIPFSYWGVCYCGTDDPIWSDWFGGFTITLQNSETLLEGEVMNQAALHGILTKINDLGLTIISVERRTPSQKESQDCLDRIQ